MTSIFVRAVVSSKARNLPLGCHEDGFWAFGLSVQLRRSRKTIVSSSLQLPPRLLIASASVTAAPPLSAIFLSVPRAQNPIQRPSGEKKGLMASSVLDSGSACS